MKEVKQIDAVSGEGSLLDVLLCLTYFTFVSLTQGLPVCGIVGLVETPPLLPVSELKKKTFSRYPTSV